MPSEFKNKYIESLCSCTELTSEINKYETNKINLRNKCIDIIELINQDQINKSKMDILTFSGVPEASLRPIVWRILMDSLSLNPSEWEQ